MGLLLSAAMQTPRRKRSTRVLRLTTTGARRAPDAACHAYAGTRVFYIWHPAGHQGRTRGRPGRDTADRGGRSDAIALASRHVRVPNRTHVLRFHDHGGTGRGGRPRCQGCPASRSQLPSPWGGRGHSRRQDRCVLDFSRCPTAAPPQHPGTPRLSREPLSGQ